MTTNRKQKQQARALAADKNIRYPQALDAVTRPRPGDRVRFDGKATSWLARAATRDGRYLLCTAAQFGEVIYTIVDFDQDIRGALNVIGYGMGIRTVRGQDPAIDETIAMLEDPTATWEVSHRNQVPLRITLVTRR